MSLSSPWFHLASSSGCPPAGRTLGSGKRLVIVRGSRESFSDVDNELFTAHSRSSREIKRDSPSGVRRLSARAWLIAANASVGGSSCHCLGLWWYWFQTARSRSGVRSCPRRASPSDLPPRVAGRKPSSADVKLGRD